jgi:hypothetical protein
MWKNPWWDQVEAGSREREGLSLFRAFKTYANLWEGKNLVIPNHQ